jgi:hypothetical protein
MAKIQVKSVFLERTLVNILYRTAINLPNLKKGAKRRAVARFIHAIVSHPKFDPSVAAGECDVCGNMLHHFQLDQDEKGVWVKIRREDRKPLYDVFVEKPMEDAPPRNLQKHLQEFAGALGYKRAFEDLELVQEDVKAVEEEEGVEYEELEEWPEDVAEEAPDAA